MAEALSPRLGPGAASASPEAQAAEEVPAGG